MSSLNKVMIIGRLGRDPEMRYTQAGKPVCSLNVATDEGYTNDRGEKVDKTEWHKVVFWDRQAETCSQYLAKGSLVFVAVSYTHLFFSAGSSSPCAAARAFASSLICSLWVSHIYLLPAFFRFRVLAPVPRKGGIARRDHEFLVRPGAVFVAVGVVRPVHRIASVNGAIRSKSS